jgi:hypothetical protein
MRRPTNVKGMLTADRTDRNRSLENQTRERRSGDCVEAFLDRWENEGGTVARSFDVRRVTSTYVPPRSGRAC